MSKRKRTNDHILCRQVYVVLVLVTATCYRYLRVKLRSIHVRGDSIVKVSV